jgi:hypothetical protein
VVLAEDYAKAGPVRHNQFQTVKAEWLRTERPHSVCLAAGGWLLLRKQRAAA